MIDASGSVNVNVFTLFGTSAGDAESVKEELKEALQSLQSCTNCILSNNARTCAFTSLEKPCERCNLRSWQQTSFHV